MELESHIWLQILMQYCPPRLHYRVSPTTDITVVLLFSAAPTLYGLKMYTLINVIGLS